MMRQIKSIWRFICRDKNRTVLSWVGGVIVATTTAGWTVKTHFFPAEIAPTTVNRGPPSAVEFKSGSTFSKSTFRFGGIVVKGCGQALGLGGNFNDSSVTVGSVEHTEAEGCQKQGPAPATSGR
jgi:hypothetical protein